MSNKQEILNNLSKWTLRNNGNFSTRKKIISLSSGEEREVREAIVNQIKQNPTRWRIEKIDVERRITTWPYSKTFWDIFVINKVTKIEKKDGILKEVDFGKMHYKRGFADKEWEEIENILKNQSTTPLEEWLEKENQPLPKLEESWWENNKTQIKWGGGIIVWIILAGLGIVWLKSKFSP